MKTGAKIPEFDTMTDEGEGKYLEFMNSIGSADWRAGPQDVLESVDDLLKKHGLEIQIYECRGDSVEFDVVKRGS